MLSGDEIRLRLQAFAARWSVYAGSERAEAQTFLNELFDCYGTDRRAVARFEDPQEGRFLDLVWDRVCIVEMKRPSEARKLANHREQALDYWRNAARPEQNLPAPQWVVVCAFSRLEIWEPGRFPNAPRLELELVALPDQYDALLFLAGDEPVFTGGDVAVTREAVSRVTDLYKHLSDDRPGELDELRDFILQCVWCLFAEDLGLIPRHLFTQLIDDLYDHPRRSSADELHALFSWLNTPGKRPDHGLFAGTPYANGGLFEQPTRIHLDRDELMLVRMAANHNWRHVEPSIFGSLLEGGLGHDKQWALGAHYTHEADIQKVVQPTIVEPWRERIAAITRHRDAVRAQSVLLSYVVLDPACGSGNFLYVAYRELRRIEQELAAREHELRIAEGRKLAGQEALNAFFPIQNMRGIEIDGFAVRLARVTLWMGHKLSVDELGIDESTLPLADLSGIQAGDALRMRWPRADAIVGNPPFHGSQHLRRVVGDDYVEWLKREFNVGVKDYCVYWFRKTHDSLKEGSRAGLVGTNSVSQNRARGASLQYIVDNGGTITRAVSTQVWPGAANVHVSIVNWVRGEAGAQALLDGSVVAGISSSLKPTSGPAVAGAQAIPANAGICFQGAIPADNGGFILRADEAHALRGDPHYAEIIRPFLTAKDITTAPDQAPSRWIIDFASRPLEQAMRYPLALQIARERVQPFRRNVRRGYRETWWLFAEPRKKMRVAIDRCTRFIGLACHGKRILFDWYDLDVLPSNAVMAFALDDDYWFGILASSAHQAWARAQNSTIKGDPRYTPSTTFETFVFPDPVTQSNQQRVADLARDLQATRRTLCAEHGIGLTKLYNLVDEGGFRAVAGLHRDLDLAVAACYGWPAAVAHDADESNRRLLALNAEIARGERPYAPFG